MKEKQNPFALLLGAAVGLALASASVCTASHPDNPKVTCGLCECFHWDESFTLEVDPMEKDGTESPSSNCINAKPKEGQITVTCPSGLPTKRADCEDCDDATLHARASDGSKTVDPVTFPFTIKTCEWKSPVKIEIVAERTTANGTETAVCKTYEICFSDCKACSSCNESAEPSGAGNPEGELDKDLELRIPVGNNEYGNSSASIELHLDNPANPGRSALDLSGWNGITRTTDGSGLTSVTTQSSYAKIETTPKTDDANAYTVTISSDPANPTTTDFRTILVENLADGSLQVTTSAFGNTRVMNWSKSGSTWTFTDGGGLKKVERELVSSTAFAYSDRLKTYEQNPGGSPSYLLVSDIKRDYEIHGGTWKKVKEEIVNPGGADLVSTWSYYGVGEETGPSSYLGVSSLKEYKRHDGYYEIHNYYEAGGTSYHLIEMPYANQYMTRTISWDPTSKTLSEKDLYMGSSTTPLARTDTIYGTDQNTRRVYTSGTSYLTTITEYHPPGTSGLGGRLKKITRPDGTITTYDYAVSGGNFVATENRGAASAGVVVEGTSTATTVSPDGIELGVTETAISAGGANAIILSQWVAYATDATGRPTTVRWFPTFSTTWDITQTYACCGLASETDEFGISTQYQYDALGRRIKTHRLGVTEAIKYAGLAVSRYRYAESVAFASGLSNEISRTEGHVAGVETKTYGPSPQTGALVALSTRTTTYSNPLGTPVSLGTGLGTKVVDDVIQVSDDGAVDPKQTQLLYFDGKPYRSWGDLEPAREYSYNANSTGPYTKTSYVDGISGTGTGGSLREIHNAYRDHADRPYRNHLSSGHNTYYYYNSLGQLERTKDADNVNTRFAYNSQGEGTVTANKLNSTTGSITYGTDRITSVETLPAVRTTGSVPVMRTITKVWKDGDTSSSGGTVVSTVDRSTDGLVTWTSTLGTAGEAVTTITRPGGGAWTVETVNPDGSKTLQTYSGGLWEKTEHKDTSNTVVSSSSAKKANSDPGYDTLNRLTHTKDSRTGVTETQYVSAISDAVEEIIPPAGTSQSTSYTYDHRGRRLTVDAPQSVDANSVPLNNITTTTYFPSGRVKQVSAHQTYPVSYTYDYAGRMKTLSTTGDAGTSITAWNYSTANGQLVSKRYDSNSSGTTGDGPSYTYTSASRLATRSWAREVSAGVKVKATYTYTYGLLTSVTYNDGTPTVTYNYNAFTGDNNHIPGDLETVTRNGATWTYKYDGTNLRPLSETHPVGGTSVERVLTRSYESQGRSDGFSLGTSGDPDLDHSVSYDFDDAGRLNEVSGDTKVFTYGYTANSSHLIASVTGPVDILVTNTWESNRNVLADKLNEVDTDDISQYTYTVNNLGQRTDVETDGSAFGSTDRGWAWGYDALGQATKAVHAASPTTLDRAYVYDSIGNRTSSTDGSGGGATTTSYTPTALNQYSAINPGTAVNPSYDLDGNLLADAGINALSYGLKYQWDAENRITAVRKADDTLLATYDYDHLGRRIRKTTTSAAYQGASDIAYLYDGWNVVAEYSISSGPAIALVQAYTWGLDLSGTLQGAGGVGGLLCIHRGPGLDGSGNRTWTDTFYPTYDGNGNVSEYLDKNGDEVAHFEYDPFGRLAYSTGSPGDFTYRFSTKPQDFESGLYYYGYRYYDPQTGRWPSRDPIQERGGFNLHGMVINDVVNRWDYLGLWTKIERNGGRWAITCAEEGDVWRFIPGGLDPSEVSKWVKNYDGETPKPGKKYLVPNVFSVYTTEATLWWKDGALSAATFARRRAAALADSKEKQGFKVIRRLQANESNTFIDLWGEEGIYGFIFAGHGSEDGFLAQTEPSKIFVTAGNVSPPYKLHIIYAWYCFSLAGQESGSTNPDGSPVVSHWADHALIVSGYEGYAFNWSIPVLERRRPW